MKREVRAIDDLDNKYFTKDLLIEANKAAIRENRSRLINPAELEELPDDSVIPVTHMYYHKRGEVRLTIVLNDKQIRFIDISTLRFLSLPSFAEDKNIIQEDEGSTKFRRPYPNNREWQESIVRKPVRKQGQFRKNVLKAYNYQCAICNVSGLTP